MDYYLMKDKRCAVFILETKGWDGYYSMSEEDAEICYECEAWEDECTYL